MRLLKMPKGVYGCLLYSAAMLLGETPEQLIEEIGHDGHYPLWPELDIPLCYQGHHIQEIQDSCVVRGFALAPIELFPCMTPQGHPQLMKRLLEDEELASVRFATIIKERPGILIGMANTGTGHAVAWDGKIIYDPNGATYDLEQFIIRDCWILTALR